MSPWDKKLITTDLEQLNTSCLPPYLDFNIDTSAEKTEENIKKRPLTQEFKTNPLADILGFFCFRVQELTQKYFSFI